jgi:hypothetical protein
MRKQYPLSTVLLTVLALSLILSMTGCQPHSLAPVPQRQLVISPELRQLAESPALRVNLTNSLTRLEQAQQKYDNARKNTTPPASVTPPGSTPSTSN